MGWHSKQRNQNKPKTREKKLCHPIKFFDILQKMEFFQRKRPSYKEVLSITRGMMEALNITDEQIIEGTGVTQQDIKSFFKDDLGGRRKAETGLKIMGYIKSYLEFREQ